MERRVTREVPVGNLTIGGENEIVVQSMTATKTQDIDATVGLVNLLQEAGAGIVRIAVDTPKDAAALEVIRSRTDANLSVDLQENYRLIAQVAPFVDKVRYNPGHLWHHEKSKSTRDKVAFLAEVAAQNDCALRVGVNCGSVDPEMDGKFDEKDTISPMIESALEHTQILDDIGFDRYVVSLKDSTPRKVVAANRRFASLRPDVPLHLGVTEAGLPKYGISKTRYALGTLLSEGIGETLRVSLTVPYEEKSQEIFVGKRLIDDVQNRRSTGVEPEEGKLNIISCPSCSRVENGAFVDLAEQVSGITGDMTDYPITIAVMGCRVNGPGETDDADLGLWCGPTRVNLKRGTEPLGSYPYDEILPVLRQQIDIFKAKIDSGEQGRE